MVRAEGLFCFMFYHWRFIKSDFISIKLRIKKQAMVRPMDKFKAKSLQEGFKWKSWFSQDKAFFSLWSSNWLWCLKIIFPFLLVFYSQTSIPFKTQDSYKGYVQLMQQLVLVIILPVLNKALVRVKLSFVKTVEQKHTDTLVPDLIICMNFY